MTVVFSVLLRSLNCLSAVSVRFSKKFKIPVLLILYVVAARSFNSNS